MPKIDYRDSNGNPISGSTTIIGSNLGWSKNALMFWSWKQGKEGKDFRETADKAAEAGTLAHAMIDAYVKNLPKPDLTGLDDGVVKKAEQCFHNFMEFATGYSFTPIKTEISLVSAHGYGSTIDCVAKVSGLFSLVDWKSSDAVYEDYLIQLASYGANWNEHFHSTPIQAYHLLRIDKNGEHFNHHRWGPEEIMGKPMEAFIHLLELHKLHKDIKRLAK